MSLIERCAQALHQRDVDDPACEPDRREWDHLTVKLQDEYRADARAVLVAADLQGAVSTLTSVRVWAEIVRDHNSDEHVRRHMRMLLGLLDGEDPDTFGGQ